MQDHPLELDAETMHAMVRAAMERIVAHLETLPAQPAGGADDAGPRAGGAELARALAEPVPPEDGTPFDHLLATVFDRAVPYTFNTAGPGYMAYIPSGGLFHAAVADLVADAINRYVGVWLAAPGLVQLEHNVVRWFCAMIGLPPGSGGILTTGGSLANQIAITTARRERLPEDFLRGTLYASSQTHHSILKAAILAGFPERNVRSIPADSRFRLRVDELSRRIAADRRDGLTPFLIVGNAGTTNTGAVDDLAMMAEVAAREKLWFHVDAAYGGFFMLTERGRRAMRGIARADSVTLDPHKGLFLPYGNGSLLVRDPGALLRAHATAADYMPAMQEDAERPDFCQLSPELSRDFRGLRVWLPIKMHGIGVFRRELDEKLDLARWITARLRELPDVEILAEPELSLVVFRLRPPGLEARELDRLNRAFLEAINRRQRVFLTETLLGPDRRFALRICVLSFRTHRERMEMALEDVRRAAEAVTSPEPLLAASTREAR